MSRKIPKTPIPPQILYTARFIHYLKKLSVMKVKSSNSIKLNQKLSIYSIHLKLKSADIRVLLFT